MESSPPPGWFETVSVREVHDGWSRVRVDTVRTPDGQHVEREIVEHDDAVAVVALTDDARIVLLKQYRQPVGGYLLEIPAGTLDVPGESPEAAVHRELAEEAQHRVRSLTHLITFHNSAGWSTERTHLYLARGAVPAPVPNGFVADAEEADMEIVLQPFDEVHRMACSGELTDAKTVLGVLLAADHVAADA